MVALQQVQCLEEVVRTKSFRGAALALGMSQPAVSGHIARLERELELVLIERAPAGSVLTPAGVRILPHLRTFVDTAEQIRRTSEQIQEPPEQSLTIVGETRRIHLAIPDAITHLSKSFEHLTVRLVSGDHDAICTDLRSGRAELGVYGQERDSGALAPDLETIPVFSLGPVGVAMPRDHPALRTEGPIAAGRLQGDPLILMTSTKANDLTERMFPEATRGPISYVDDVGLGLELVQQGLGMMVLSGVTCYLANPSVSWRAIKGAPELILSLARSRARDLSPVAQAFVDYMTAWCAGCVAGFRYDPLTGAIEASAWVDQWIAAGSSPSGQPPDASVVDSMVEAMVEAMVESRAKFSK